MDPVIFELKAMILRLLQINGHRYYTLNLPEDQNIENARERLRDVVENMLNNKDIPLHWYEYSDEIFQEKVLGT